jgi:hypothetical protein
MMQLQIARLNLSYSQRVRESITDFPQGGSGFEFSDSRLVNKKEFFEQSER